jgi:site-specific recombinase XerD
MKTKLGQIVHSFFEDYLVVQKGLRVSSIRSYRDTMRLFLNFVAQDTRRSISRLAVEDLTIDQVLAFLKYIENERGNHIRSRNQRLAALRTFFDYAASRLPELLHTAQRVVLIPVKRSAPPETHYLEREEVASILRRVGGKGRHALRDRTLLLFLYNTGARVQETADLQVKNLEFDSPSRVRLHGKGDKWRTCPLWSETVKQLKRLLQDYGPKLSTESPVFCSRPGTALTRFGIYKNVRKHGSSLDTQGLHPRRITPHSFRHTAAVHLLESGVEVNVIRGWLGHVSLETTNRYAELTLRAKEAALRECERDLSVSVGFPRYPVWKDDKSLLGWLDSL